MRGNILDWLQPDKKPANYYILLGIDVLHPSTTEISIRIRAAVRQVHPYQRHTDPKVVTRAQWLTMELGRAETIFRNPQRLLDYESQVIAQLIDQIRAHHGNAATDETVRQWLVQEAHVHPDRVDELIHRWTHIAGETAPIQQSETATIHPVRNSFAFIAADSTPSPVVSSDSREFTRHTNSRSPPAKQISQTNRDATSASTNRIRQHQTVILASIYSIVGLLLALNAVVLTRKLTLRGSGESKIEPPAVSPATVRPRGSTEQPSSQDPPSGRSPDRFSPLPPTEFPAPSFPPENPPPAPERPTDNTPPATATYLPAPTNQPSRFAPGSTVRWPGQLQMVEGTQSSGQVETQLLVACHSDGNDFLCLAIAKGRQFAEGMKDYRSVLETSERTGDPNSSGDQVVLEGQIVATPPYIAAGVPVVELTAIERLNEPLSRNEMYQDRDTSTFRTLDLDVELAVLLRSFPENSTLVRFRGKYLGTGTYDDGIGMVVGLGTNGRAVEVAFRTANLAALSVGEIIDVNAQTCGVYWMRETPEGMQARHVLLGREVRRDDGILISTTPLPTDRLAGEVVPPHQPEAPAAPPAAPNATPQVPPAAQVKSGNQSAKSTLKFVSFSSNRQFTIYRGAARDALLAGCGAPTSTVSLADNSKADFWIGLATGGEWRLNLVVYDHDNKAKYLDWATLPAGLANVDIGPVADELIKKYFE